MSDLEKVAKSVSYLDQSRTERSGERRWYPQYR